MTRQQYKHFGNAMNKIVEQFDANNLLGAAKSAKVLGAIIQVWATNGRTRVYTKEGKLKKKYIKSK